ncbi:MAG: Crp/Fnr family transcriptional regulator [Minwuia sp.]|nr:Crp/Fnr family transcriptional regulator [Minwuia sp.]
MIEVHLQKISELLAKHGVGARFPLGHHVFHQGDSDRRLYFVREGHLKAYYTRIDGREQVKSLIGPGSTIGSLASMEDEGACTFSLVAISEVSLVSLTFDLLVSEAQKDIAVANEVIDFLVMFARRKERREHDLLCLSAEERYRQFLEENPSDTATVSQADIAAYIGVTPQALSRIKRRIVE